MFELILEVLITWLVVGVVISLVFCWFCRTGRG